LVRKGPIAVYTFLLSEQFADAAEIFSTKFALCITIGGAHIKIIGIRLQPSP
jgi:hypothetical protein